MLVKMVKKRHSVVPFIYHSPGVLGVAPESSSNALTDRCFFSWPPWPPVRTRVGASVSSGAYLAGRGFSETLSSELFGGLTGGPRSFGEGCKVVFWALDSPDFSGASLEVAPECPYYATASFYAIGN